MTATIIRTVAEVRKAVGDARRAGLRIGFVPTMGALHEGHASLIREAAAETGFAIASVFVNPTQFGPNEDFAKYPRQLEADRLICESAGAKLVFAPSPEEMYPKGFATHVDIAGLGDHLCGRSRPGHFRGVCTVVTKLLNIVAPDISYFGQKDAQQARIIQQFVEDLNIPGEVKILPTHREADGLAMSSRNRYLSESQRRNAKVLSHALRLADELYQNGERTSKAIRNQLEEMISKIPEARIDYMEMVDAKTLQPVERIDNRTLLALAVYFGTTRLIDNTFLG